MTDAITRPSGDDTLSRQLDGLSPTKRAFVEQRLREARARAASSSEILRAAEGEPAPLSFAQELLWRLEGAAADTSAYNVPRAMQVRGALDVEQLQRALDKLVERHAILRTSFIADGDDPVQIVRIPRAVSLTQFDAGSTEEAHRIIREQAAAPFDLAKDLLLRATLVHLGPDEHVLLLLSHHIASDGSSGGIMLRDLDALYRGEDETLAPLAIQYSDYASWQRSQVNAARVDELLGYWRTTLASAPARLELPTDRPRPLAPAFAGARRSTLLPRHVADAVHQTAREHSTTPFVVLLAAFEVLLHRYSRQDDIVVGTVVTGRGQPELEGLIGYFSNTLPVRVTFGNDHTFSDVIARVRDASLGANAHADLPYERIALNMADGKAGPSPRSGRQASLFDIMFAMIDEGAALGALGDAVVVPIALDRGVAKFDLTIGPAFSGDGLRVGMEYRTDLFDDATIVRMLGHYGNVLAAATKAPRTAVSRLPILSADERDLVLKEWNRTTVAYPADATLVSLLEAQERRTPNAIAVALAGQAAEPDAPTTLTFAELDARSTTLARALVYRGVKPGVLVGVCMERSLELVVALVAVLKAGGAYVPLDPEYPADRLAFMIGDARCQVLLTQKRVADTVLSSLAHEDSSRVDVLCVDSEWRSIVSDATTLAEPLPAVAPDDLAYMIYTSGSTGKPKGALNRHRGIVNRLLWMQDEYELTGADAVLQKTPFSFDVSVWEFFLPLLAGARLVIAEPGGHRDPAYLAEVIVEQKITVLHFVPSMLRAFLEEPAAATCGATLRDVMCSGEALPYDLQQRFFAIVCGDSHAVGLHNLYGPTECAVDVSYWACIRDDERHTVPIGRPVANTQLYVLDEAMEPVPIGVAGELYLGGVQVGAGYWGRPELTNDRFVKDPFSTAPDARLYKTGDLARWLADGVVEYLGRLDFQVKLRGFRIELGEIEAALSAHAGVREVVVVAREDLPGGAALIAYYSTRGDTRPTAAELRALLRGSLPDYMVPSAFVELETLPLSPSGKVDRKALPVPEELAAVEAEFVAPRSAAEEQVAAIWREVLHVDQVGVHDDFFDIGGHSLLAMRVAGRIHSATGIRIPFRELFTLRTVESLAARLGSAGAETPDETIPARDDKADAPLSFAQELLWLQAQMSPAAATYNVPMALRINGAFDLGRLRSALKTLTERHEALRTSFVEGEDGARQRIAPAARTNVMEIDLAGWEAEDREEAALVNVRRAALEPFDLTRAPLMRVAVVKLAPDDAILLIVVHHIVFDGGSVGILLDELFSLYEHDAAGALPEIGAQYADFAAWQRTRLSGTHMDRLRAFWSAELLGAPERVSLPKEKGAKGAVREGRRVEASIAADALPALRRIGRERGATLHMTLLAAFQSLLHLASGDADVVVGSPVSGREQAEVEHTIGFFANTLPMRARFDAATTFDSLLKNTRDAALRAYEHQDMPYEQLLLDRIAERHASDAALFSVLFVQQDDSANDRSLGDATATAMPTALDSAKFDLALSVRDDGDALHASLHYRADLLEDATAQSLLSRYALLLDAIASDPMSPVRGLETAGAVAAPATNGSGPAVPVEGEYVPAEGPVEQVIAGVWSEMLGRTRISRDSRFFDVGGHSLLATRIVARVSALLRVRIPIRAFFADPTIGGMAAAMVSAETRAGQTATVARAVLELRGMSAEDRARLAATRSPATTPDLS